jgi:soluble lytic murein transglycosylase
MAIEYLDDPKVNIDLGTWYVKHLLNNYDGDQVRAVAAYNAGPGKVGRWLVDQQWDGTFKKVNDIPYKETRNFVQRVMYYHNRYEKIYANDFR